MIDIERLTKLDKEGTEPLWKNAGYGKNGQTVIGGPHDSTICQIYGFGPAMESCLIRGGMRRDAFLIAEARNALPELLAELKLLRERVEYQQEIIRELKRKK